MVRWLVLLAPTLFLSACATLDGLSGGAPDASAPAEDAATPDVAVPDAATDATDTADASDAGTIVPPTLRVQTNAVGDGTTKTIDLSVPAVTKTGDLLWITIVHASAASTITAPPALTVVSADSHGCDLSRLRVYAKTAGIPDAEPSSYSFTLNADATFDASLFVFDGVTLPVRKNNLQVVPASAPVQAAPFLLGTGDVPSHVFLTFARKMSTAWTVPGLAPIATSDTTAIFLQTATTAGTMTPPAATPTVCAYAGATVLGPRFLP